METIIVDSGPLYALLDSSEEHHSWTRERLNDVRPPLSTCDAVLTETCFLLARFSASTKPLHTFIAKGFLRPHQFDEKGYSRVFELMETYHDVPMSFADACLVCMVEQQPGSAVLTLDRDFEVYRQHRRRLIPLIAPF